jgi:PIN domain nuclease of toxin-antitoxin system
VTPLLLDTCAVIWLAEEASIAKAAADALLKSMNESEPIYLSPVSGWEIGMLVANRRLKLPLPPDAWFERALARPELRLTDLSIRILIAASFLPGTPPRDPADRILAATAREKGYRLVTRDRQLLKYADHGHVQAVAC